MITNGLPWLAGMLLKLWLQAAILAVFVWIIARLCHKAPARFRHTLWVLVLVKLLVPPFAYFPSELAFWQSKQTPAPVYAHVNAPVSTTASMKTSDVYMPAPYLSTPGPSESQTHAIGLYDIFALVWAAGTTAMLGLLAYRKRKQRRLFSDSIEADEHICNIMIDSARALGVRHLPRLAICRYVSSPSLVGLVCPTIFLPPLVAESCGSGDVRAMLLHELAHVKRHDMLIVWFLYILRCILFFHPAVWLASREVEIERELACDELVVATPAISKTEYASGFIAALKLAKTASVMHAALGMAEPYTVSKRRLDVMLAKVLPKFSIGYLAAMIAICTVGLPTFAGSKAYTKDNTATISADTLAGTKAVTKPGVIVALHNSPKLAPSETRQEIIEQYSVHDIDIRNIVNELFLAGAEAISVNGQRVVANSAIQSKDKVFYINATKVTSPFVITATGNPDNLSAAMYIKGSQTESFLLLGMIRVEKRNNVTVPARATNTLPAGVSYKDTDRLAGLTQLSGSGITVALHNSSKLDPTETRQEIIEQCLIHDNDIRNIVNELFSAGAEAISINDERLVVTSSIISMEGSKVSINGDIITQPYTIKALGNPARLEKALQKRGGATEALSMLDMINISKSLKVAVPAYVVNHKAGVSTVSQQNKPPTTNTIAEALKKQEALCGPSLDVRIRDGDHKIHYIRTPEFLVYEDEFHSSQSRLIYDRLTRKTKHLNIVGTGEVYSGTKQGINAVFTSRSLVETSRFWCESGPLVEDIARGSVSKKMEKIDGHWCWRVNIPSARKNVKGVVVWVDPVIGFCPRRVQTLWKSMITLFASNLRDYKEIGPGVWFPSKMTWDYEGPDGKKHGLITVDNAKIGTSYSHKELLSRLVYHQNDN